MESKKFLSLLPGAVTTATNRPGWMDRRSFPFWVQVYAFGTLGPSLAVSFLVATILPPDWSSGWPNLLATFLASAAGVLPAFYVLYFRLGFPYRVGINPVGMVVEFSPGRFRAFLWDSVELRRLSAACRRGPEARPVRVLLSPYQRRQVREYLSPAGRQARVAGP